MIDGATTKEPERPSRFTIGVLIDSVDSYFIHRAISDLIDAAEEGDLHLVFYFGGSLEKGKTAGPYSYAFTLPDPSAIQALIVLPNTISPYDPKIASQIIIDQFPDIPIYFFFCDVPGHYSVCADESSAIEALILHLVEDHSYHKIALLCGPDAPDSVSRKRLIAIQDILANRGLSIEPTFLFSGDFTTQDGVNAARNILSQENAAPEALICMNDQMAIGAIREFGDSGIAIPEDIAVVGFDGVEEGNTLPCTLTSIDFPIWEMISTMVERISTDLSGRTEYSAEKVVMKAHFMRRESCGCTSWFDKTALDNDSFIPPEQLRTTHSALKRAAVLRKALEEGIEECIIQKNTQPFETYIHKTIQSLLRSGDFTNSFIDIFSTQWTITLLRHTDFESQVLINALFVDAFRLLLQTKSKIFARSHANDLGSLQFYQNCNELLSQKLPIYEAIKAIGLNLPQLGINRCLIVFISEDDPELGEIRLSYKEGYFREVSKSDFTTIPIKKLVDTGVQSIHEPIGIMTVAHENTVYGYLVLSIRDKHFEQFSMIQRMVSQIVDSAMTNELLSSHIQNLTKNNDLLSRLSIVDEFTGLYNRRALYVSGRNMYQQSVNEGHASGFIFLDMDGLKKINDTFGHKEGDAAILALSGILKKCFRERDLVVRYGGDEFVILMVNVHEELLRHALGRIKTHLDEFNSRKSHPWTLSASWGYVFNDANSVSRSFENIIEESDARLYEEKRKKKAPEN